MISIYFLFMMQPNDMNKVEVNHMIVQQSLKFSSCSFFLLMMKTSLTGLKLILFMLFCSPIFLAVILFSLNILWDYLLSALLCLVNVIISFWLFYLSYLSYYKPNILSIEGLRCFDILLFFYNFDNEVYNGEYNLGRI